MQYEKVTTDNGLSAGWTVEHAQWLSIANPDTLSAEIRVILHNLGVLATKVDQLTHAVVAALGGGSAGAKPKVMADENEEDALRRIAELPDGTVDNTLKVRSHICPSRDRLVPFPRSIPPLVEFTPNNAQSDRNGRSSAKARRVTRP